MSERPDPRLIVLMREDYTTQSQNLGKRTFAGNQCYQVCQTTLDELVDAGVADQVDPRKHLPTGVVGREQVTVVPKVSRWFTANGADTHYLVKGVKKRVPSNLATFLTLNGYAEAA